MGAMGAPGYQDDAPPGPLAPSGIPATSTSSATISPAAVGASGPTGEYFRMPKQLGV